MTSVLPGLDALARGFEPDLETFLRARRVGLATNPTGTTVDEKPALQILRDLQIPVQALFSPEHGFRADQEGHIASGFVDELPVHSLYGATRRPTPEMLANLDAVVFDLQDVGARFYTYSSTLFHLLEACAEANIAVVVLDRPNPLGDGIEGPLIEPELFSFIGMAPIPVRHGMTLGELARFFVDWKKLEVELHVVQIRDWKRHQRWNSTDLKWRRPSPNLPDFRAAAWYPGLCLLEFSDVSVGRGTDAPFQILAAPWLRPLEFIGAMPTISGLICEEVEVTPTHAVFAEEKCRGVRFSFVDEDHDISNPVAFGLCALSALRRSHPEFLRESWDKAAPLVGSRAVLEKLWNDDLDSVLEEAKRDAETFRRQRAPFLIYD